MLRVGVGGWEGTKILFIALYTSLIEALAAATSILFSAHVQSRLGTEVD
jgi:hypothetical protein